MVDVKKYQKIEAMEELLDDHDLIIAGLDAAMALIAKRIQTVQSKLKLRKSANEKAAGYLRLIGFKKEFHLTEIRKITLQQHRDGLREKLKNLI